MRRRCVDLMMFNLLGLILLAVSATAGAVSVQLDAHNQRSSSGTRSTLVWKDCGSAPAQRAPCISFSSDWVIANGVTGSTATWEWDPVGLVLSATGTYWVTSFISSGPSGTPVLSDRVVDLVIDIDPVDPFNSTTSASAYECIEGTFLRTVGASGCGSYNLGPNVAPDSPVAYNVGGDPYCVIRALGGDDLPTGNPRGVRDSFALPGCDDTSGAFNLFTVVEDNLSTGGKLILSNGVCLGAPGEGTAPPVYAPCSGANWMTFSAVPIPAVGWLLAPAFGVLGWRRRSAPRTCSR